jgi:hypothetical protein
MGKFVNKGALLGIAIFTAINITGCSKNNSAGYIDGIWTPGTLDAAHPNIHAAQKEGAWIPNPGYIWISTSNTSLDVTWQPYRVHDTASNVMAMDREGYWMTAPGYQFVKTGSEVAMDGESLDAVWTPNITHPACTFLKSSSSDQHWVPISGYQLINSDPDSVVLHKIDEQSSSDRFNRVLGDIIGAAILGSMAKPDDNDGFIATSAKAAIKEVQGKVIVDGWKTAMTADTSGDIHCDLRSKIWTRPLKQTNAAEDASVAASAAAPAASDLTPK